MVSTGHGWVTWVVTWLPHIVKRCRANQMSTLDTVLPASSVLRVIKESIPDGFHINREAKSVLSRAGAVFAVYLSAAANDAAREGKRSTMKASDVLRALEDVELPEFAAALRHDLEGEREARLRARLLRGMTDPLLPTFVMYSSAEFQNEQARTRKKTAKKTVTYEEDEEILDGPEEGFAEEDEYAEEADAGSGAIEVDGGEGVNPDGRGSGGAETMPVDGSEDRA